MRKFLYSLSAAVAVAGLALGGASAASASVHAPATYNSAGEAGYYIQHANGWRFRDVRADFTVAATQDTLSNGATGVNGGEGVQLCNNDTGDAIQFGLVPSGDPGVFNIAYSFGQLPDNGQDPCATDGVLTNDPALWTTHGFKTAAVGDKIKLEIYYDKATGIALLAITKNGLQESQPINPCSGEFETAAALNGEGFRGCHEFYYEAGAGLQQAGQDNLSAPAVNSIVSFTGLRLTSYDGTRGTNGFFHSSWITKTDESNTAGSATGGPALVAPGPTSGSSFTVFGGSPVGP